MQQLMFKLDQNPKVAAYGAMVMDCFWDATRFFERTMTETSKLDRTSNFKRLSATPMAARRRGKAIGGLAGMSWRERANAIRGLQSELAAVIYRVRGDIRPLQEVTFEFMQRTTNAAYDEAIELYNAGKLKVRLSPQEAIGNYVDDAVRIRLGLFLDGLEIPTDSESTIRVNRRAYNSSGPSVSYRLPDIRVGNFAFDVSLRAKQASDPQIKGFFNADFKPIGVVIVRPNQLGNASSYIIWRAKGD
jgi:hypothetical protein